MPIEIEKPGATYKCWSCSYICHGDIGLYEDYECIVIAETKSKALALALKEYPDTVSTCWLAKEIPLNKEGVYHIINVSDCL